MCFLESVKDHLYLLIKSLYCPGGLTQILGLENVVFFKLIPQLCLRLDAEFFNKPDFEQVYLPPLDLNVDTDKQPFTKVNALLLNNKLI